MALVYQPGTNSWVDVPEPTPPGQPLPTNPDLNPGVPFADDPNNPNARPLVLSPGQEAPPMALAQTGPSPSTEAGLPPFAVTMPPAPGAPGAPPPAVTPAAAPATPAVPQLTTESKTTTSTTSGVKQTPELRDATIGLKAAAETAKESRENAIEADRQAQLAGQKLATDTASLAAQARQAEEANNRAMAELQQRHDAADAAARKQVDAANEAVKGFKFRDFWANKSTARRVGSALAVAMGAFGAALTKTPNFALQILDKEMDDDHRLQVDDLGKLKDEQVMARTGLQDAQQARTQAMAALNIKHAGALRLVAAQLEESKARSNDTNYQKVVDADIARKRQQADAEELKGRELLQQNALAMAPKTSTTTVTSRKVAEGTGAGGAGASLAASDAVAKLRSDIRSLDSVISESQQKPASWIEFRKNAEGWKRAEAASKVKGIDWMRAAGQGLGAFNVSEEQGLESAGAKKVYQGMQEALTSIAKGYGGVITEGDRQAAAAGLAVLNQSPAEAVRTLQQIRANLADRLAGYSNIRGIGAQAAPPAPNAAPAGGAAEAKAWLATNPNHPRARAVRERLQQMGAM